MNKNPFYFIIILLSFLGCNNKISLIHNFDEAEWDYTKTVIFNFDINDTSKTYDLMMVFCNTLNYQYQNLYLIIETRHKNNTISTDTVHYNITDKYGKWLGKGGGSIKNNYFNYKNNVVFDQIGTYSLELKHGMRTNPLPGSSSIGVQIIQND
tara:strand:+ start:55 stop:513 length:459 start_codon:yes stop_codon:yes gene_type:complete